MSIKSTNKTLLTGGTAAALDSIDGATLLDGDRAFVAVSGVLYYYVLDDDSGAAEASPNIIAPDTNPGNKRWILQAINCGSGTIAVDHIGESTAAHGVVIDGVTLKDGTVNGLTPTALAVGFTVAGGTTSKTLTVSDNSTIDQDLQTTAGPTFDHLHIEGAGGVQAEAEGAVLAAVNPTNQGISSVGATGGSTLADNETITFTMQGGAIVFTVYCSSSGVGGVFAAERSSATITKLHDPGSFFEVTNTDTTKIAVFKSAGAGIVNIKNYMNTSRAIQVMVLGRIASATAPV